MPQSTESLCLACGLCCNGVLFGAVRVAPVAQPRLVSLGLTVVQRPDGSQRLLQPCPALQRSGERVSCDVYVDRPDACRSFDCLLARALHEGEVSLEEALAEVAEARRAVSSVEALLPPAAEPLSIEQRIAQVTAPHPSLTAAAASLRARLDRVFRGRQQR